MTRATIQIPRRLAARMTLGLLLMAAIGWTAAGTSTALAQTPSTEYQVKAACILNFIQFIQWPAAAFPDAKAPIIVGVLGDDPFGAALEQTFEDESIQGRKLVVKRLRKLEDLKACSLLFISKSEKERVGEILAGVGDEGMVTVSEVEGFARRGGIINFYIEGGKVRFEINPSAAERKGLRINSQLLKRARIVSLEGGKGGK